MGSRQHPMSFTVMRTASPPVPPCSLIKNALATNAPVTIKTNALNSTSNLNISCDVTSNRIGPVCPLNSTHNKDQTVTVKQSNSCPINTSTTNPQQSIDENIGNVQNKDSTAEISGNSVRRYPSKKLTTENLQAKGVQSLEKGWRSAGLKNSQGSTVSTVMSGTKPSTNPGSLRSLTTELDILRGIKTQLSWNEKNELQPLMVSVLSLSALSPLSGYSIDKLVYEKRNNVKSEGASIEKDIKSNETHIQQDTTQQPCEPEVVNSRNKELRTCQTQCKIVDHQEICSSNEVNIKNRKAALTATDHEFYSLLDTIRYNSYRYHCRFMKYYQEIMADELDQSEIKEQLQSVSSEIEKMSERLKEAQDSLLLSREERGYRQEYQSISETLILNPSVRHLDLEIDEYKSKKEKIDETLAGSLLRLGRQKRKALGLIEQCLKFRNESESTLIADVSRKNSV